MERNERAASFNKYIFEYLASARGAPVVAFLAATSGAHLLPIGRMRDQSVIL